MTGRGMTNNSVVLHKKSGDMKYSNLKIGIRLAISFAAVLLLLIVVAIVGWKSLAATKNRIEVITSENNVKIASANAMRGFLNVETRSTRNVLLYTDPAVRANQKERIAKSRTQYNEAKDTLTSLVRGDGGKKLLADINASQNAVRPEFDKVVAFANASQEKEGADYLLSKVQGPQDQWFTVIQTMIELQEAQ